MARSHAFLRYVSSESFRSLQVSQHETTTGEYKYFMIFRDLFEEVCRSLSGCVSTLIPPVRRSGHFLQVFYGSMDIWKNTPKTSKFRVGESLSAPRSGSSNQGEITFRALFGKSYSLSTELVPVALSLFLRFTKKKKSWEGWEWQAKVFDDVWCTITRERMGCVEMHIFIWIERRAPERVQQMCVQNWTK